MFLEEFGKLVDVVIDYHHLSREPEFTLVSSGVRGVTIFSFMCSVLTITVFFSFGHCIVSSSLVSSNFS